GRIDDAIAEAESALALADTPRFALAWTRAARVLADAAVRRGDLTSADAYVRRIDAHLEAGGVWPGDRWAAACLAEAVSGPGAALSRISDCLDELEHGSYWLVLPEVERLPQVFAWATANHESLVADTVLDCTDRLTELNPDHRALDGAV